MNEINIKQEETIDYMTDFGNMSQTFYLIGLINRFNNGFQTVADAMFKEISWKQVFFLNCVKLFKEPPTIKEMAEIVGCSHQNANQILSKLEKMGYIELHQDQMDRRKQRIILTNKANEFNNRYDEPSSKAMARLFEGIDEKDLEITVKVIAQLLEKLNIF